MNKTIVTILIGILVILAGLYFFTNVFGDNGLNGNGANGNGDTPASWETYRSEQFNFSMQYPPEATVDIEAGNHVNFTLISPDAEEATEITDGFTFTVSTYEKASSQSLEAFAEAQYQSSLQVADSVDPVTQTTVNGRAAYTYAVSNIGTVVHYALPGATDARAYVLSSNVADPNNQGYQQMVNQMRASFRILDESDGSGDGAPVYDTVSIAVLQTEGVTDPERGCDRVIMTERAIEPTTAPLTAAMNELFSLESEQISGYYNFMARTNSTLAFDRAAVEDGTAHIYLTGELSGLAGVCDNPRAAIQIEETALQFATVNDVVLYLNGDVTDLTPDGRGL